MLQAQVMELQMKCNALTITNQRLMEKLNELVESNEDKKKLIRIIFDIYLNNPKLHKSFINKSI